jgi:ribonuclease BN (tRNA processing enzyme)
MVSVILLGSGTGVPTARRAPPGLLIRSAAEEGGTILLDPGPGAVSRMAKAGTAVEEVDRVVFTHHHPDHTLDLMALLFARRNPWLKPRLKRLTLIGPRGTVALHEAMKNLYGDWVSAEPESFRIEEVGEGPLPGRTGLTGSAHRVTHIEGSLGYRFDFAAGTLAVSGDTEPCEGLADLGRDADLFFLECAVPDEMEQARGHMTPRAAGEAAARANPAHLVLYHLYWPVDPQLAAQRVRSLYSGRVTVAEDGDRFELK